MTRCPRASTGSRSLRPSRAAHSAAAWARATTVPPPERAAALADVMARFDDVVESSKVGVRKPERRFYEIACERLGVTPDECIFLDDLGINLKPAAQMGMITIKVTSAEQAIRELVALLWP